MRAVPSLTPLDEYRWQIDPDPGLGMRVPGILFSSTELIASLRNDPALQQLANVATLPGIQAGAYAMPDIHFGYGFPVGGVAAFDMQEGVVSPGGIGYDINCGVRLLRTGLVRGGIASKLGPLMDALYRAVPSGVGSKGGHSLSAAEMNEVLAEGARWAVRKGFGRESDLKFQEEGGCLGGAEAARVSDTARRRGERQLGTLGSGNHFLEVQAVDKVFFPEFAERLGLASGDVLVMLHTGSRGLGHQIAADYIRTMDASLAREGTVLADRQLSCAPISSEEAQAYLAAMAGGANFAWANRQMITHAVREAFARVFPGEAGLERIDVVYDIAHNMAKRETHRVNGGMRDVLVHRKGATRAFGPGREEVPSDYRQFGQPVLIPGDMGTASYLLVGLATSLERSFGSSCHGAGRLLSRSAAVRRFRYGEVTRALSERGIQVRAASREGVTEEAPGAYKDVEQVVRVAEGAGLTRRVARLVPLGVVKG